MNISYDSGSLITELKADIVEFGDFDLWAYSKVYMSHRFYTDYYPAYEKAIDGNQRPSLNRDEKMEQMKAKKLLQLLIEQNRIV